MQHGIYNTEYRTRITELGIQNIRNKEDGINDAECRTQYIELTENEDACVLRRRAEMPL